MGAFLLRIKLLLADRVATVCYILCVAVMVLVFFNMNIYASDASRVPVGVICESDSPSAERLFESLKKSDALRVSTGSMEELEELLMDGYIGSIFVIGDDYEEKLRAGIKEDIIKVITPTDDTSSIIVRDIVAGYMMYDVCFFRTYDEYAALPQPNDTGGQETQSKESGEKETVTLPKMSEEEFSEYVQKVASDPIYGFDFDIEYRDIKSGSEKDVEITTAMIYRQIIAGLIGMLLMVICVCGCNGFALECGQSILKRKRTTGSSMLLSYGLEMCAVLVYLTPAVILSSLIMIEESGIWGAVCIFLMGEALCALFIMICSAIALFIKSASAYQLVGTVVCLVLGACGFINTFSAMTGTSVLGWTPVAAYINGFAEMLI
ncbi:MAG: ABC transporter permease [Lachnospiraceae bacterium]|nr:ABC transporter permease [Lachnospiraceae bacterium]